MAHQRLSHMSAPQIFPDRIGGISEMSASSNIIRMKDVQSQNLPIFLRHCGKRLFSKKSLCLITFKDCFLWKRICSIHHLIPYHSHFFQILCLKFSDFHLIPVPFLLFILLQISSFLNSRTKEKACKSISLLHASIS